MIPVADVIPSRTTPWVTVGIIAVNVLVFGLASWALGAGGGELVRQAAFVPADVSWRSAASLVVHENGLHLALNVVALWVFGDNVEDQLGHGRFLVVYAGAGVAAAIGAAWAAPASLVPMVGSSGAVAGVIGSYLVLFPRSRVLVLVPSRAIVDVVEFPALFIAGAWLLPHLVGGLGRLAVPWGDGGSVVLWWLAGGLSAGMIGAKIAGRPERRRVEWWGR
jgi:membrane associated rhomboid family serine protease